MDRFHQRSKLLACGLGCLLFGCCSCCGWPWRDPCADIPSGAIPQPTGAHTCAWQSAQAALADQDDFVIYQYEWRGESTELSPFGQQHLASLVSRLNAQPCSVIVEPSENPSLDAQRHDSLIALLAAYGVPSAELRVSLGSAAAEGLHGQEASRLERGYFRSGSRGGGLGGGGLGNGGGWLGGGGLGGRGGGY